MREEKTYPGTITTTTMLNDRNGHEICVQDGKREKVALRGVRVSEYWFKWLPEISNNYKFSRKCYKSTTK
ncbi:hypothetical protein WN55_08217 [Dufourea novaeangliae]|uniref:Uncharacterized protein n=1 Tax=Dufourea novaeangliae TaxID=178035 RepID=A0A154P781_DUFNO|nr:hypothetical protein WN55_08217 [Dufourea novaeangliae]